MSESDAAGSSEGLCLICGGGGGGGEDSVGVGVAGAGKLWDAASSVGVALGCERRRNRARKPEESSK